MSTLWIVVAVALALAVIGVLFFWYQERRARASLKKVDRSRLKNLDEDGWDDW